MSRKQFLTEHMDYIYLAENVIPYFNKLKANAAKIGKVLATFNIIRIHDVFNTVNDVPPKQISAFAKKKYGKYYRKIQIRKGNDEVRELLLSYYSALVTLKDETTDPKVREQISDAIEHTDSAGDEFHKYSKGKTISVIGIAHIIGHLLKGSVFVSPFLRSSGNTFMPACIMILSLAGLINLFMTAKKEHKKVID